MHRLQLFYVADPMCSWCWGFSPTIRAIEDRLADPISLHYVMGGLAPDSNEPMPDHLSSYVQKAWRSVADRTGAEFNWDFWTRCQPRRSTYPACRAVLAASLQAAASRMFHAIQHAYYLEARNPSDASTLVAIAGELSLDAERFSRDLSSPEIESRLQEDFALRRLLRADSFPSLILKKNDSPVWIARGWEDSVPVLDRIQAAMADAEDSPH
jgi:putative protein-disulfide isomerase